MKNGLCRGKGFYCSVLSKIFNYGEHLEVYQDSHFGDVLIYPFQDSNNQPPSFWAEIVPFVADFKIPIVWEYKVTVLFLPRYSAFRDR